MLDRAHLAAHFAQLADDELVHQCEDGLLVPQALSIAVAEAQARGLAVRAVAADDVVEPAPALAEATYEGDFVTIEQQLTPTEAHTIASFLASAGIDARAADTQLVQAHGLLSVALGGARVRVPAERAAEARALIGALRRGEFALDDDFDPDASR